MHTRFLDLTRYNKCVAFYYILYYIFLTVIHHNVVCLHICVALNVGYNVVYCTYELFYRH